MRVSAGEIVRRERAAMGRRPKEYLARLVRKPFKLAR